MKRGKIIHWIHILENDQAWVQWEVGRYLELHAMRKELVQLLKQYLEAAVQDPRPDQWSGILKLAPMLAKDEDWRLEDDAKDLHPVRKRLARDLKQRLEELKAELDSLIQKEEGKIRGKLRKMLGLKAEDVSQDVFAKAYEKLEGLADPRKLKNWLWVVAVNTGRSAMTAQRDEPEPIGGLDPPGGGSDALGRMITVDVFNAVSKAIDDLPAMQKHCFLLWYQGPDEGGRYSYKDIAKILNIKVSPVKSHIHQAREKLKRVALEAEKGI